MTHKTQLASPLFFSCHDFGQSPKCNNTLWLNQGELKHKHTLKQPILSIYFGKKMYIGERDGSVRI